MAHLLGTLWRTPFRETDSRISTMPGGLLTETPAASDELLVGWPDMLTITWLPCLDAALDNDAL